MTRPDIPAAEKARLCRVDQHTRECDYHADQYWWECTCGALVNAVAIAKAAKERK